MWERVFAFERATKRTYRFKELVAAGQAPLVDVIYVQKTAFTAQPVQIRVTVEVVK